MNATLRTIFWVMLLLGLAPAVVEGGDWPRTVTLDDGGTVTIYEPQVEEMDESFVRFRAALDSSLDNIYLIDRATMRFVDANRAGWQNLGYSKDELLKLGPHNINYEYKLDDLSELFDQITGSDDNAAADRQHDGRCRGNPRINTQGGGPD